MKKIDNYINNFCNGAETEEIKELKNEVKDHLLELVKEFTNEGIDIDKAIDMAIEQFDDGPQMKKEILKLLRTNNLKLLKYNKRLLKLVHKIVNISKSVLLISTLIFGVSIGYCAFAQHQTSSINNEVNTIIDKLIKKDNISNKEILNTTLNNYFANKSEVNAFIVQELKDNKVESIYTYRTNKKTKDTASYLSRQSNKEDSNKITKTNKKINYLLFMNGDLYYTAKIISTASMYICILALITCLITLVTYKKLTLIGIL